MNLNFDLDKILIGIIKLIELYRLRKVSSMDVYLKKIDDLEKRKMRSKHPELYDEVIAEVKKRIYHEIRKN